MKLQLLNTPMGLKPLYDADFDEKKKLKIGEVYERVKDVIFVTFLKGVSEEEFMSNLIHF